MMRIRFALSFLQVAAIARICEWKGAVIRACTVPGLTPAGTRQTAVRHHIGSAGCFSCCRLFVSCGTQIRNDRAHSKARISACRFVIEELTAWIMTGKQAMEKGA